MRRAFILCVLVAGCGGSKPAPIVHTATQPKHSPVEVSLHGPDTRRVVFGHPLTLRGVVRPNRPVTVRLLATEYPYPVSEPVDSTTTGEGGSFHFTVRPRLNSMYSVEAESRVSRHIQVYALPDGNFRVEPLGPGSGVFVYEITHPAGVVPTKRPVQFYVHLTRHGKRFTRVGGARFERVTRERAVARLTVTLHEPADDAVACVPAMIAEGFGDPPIAGCGLRRVRVPRH